MLCELVSSTRGRGMHISDCGPVLRNSAEIVSETLVKQSLTIPHFTEPVQEIAGAEMGKISYVEVENPVAGSWAHRPPCLSSGP